MEQVVELRDENGLFNDRAQAILNEEVEKAVARCHYIKGIAS
jgi:hypothetical protein